MIRVGELREQIIQNAQRTKNEMTLQELAVISDLFRKCMDGEDYKFLSDDELTKISLIRKILNTNDSGKLNKVNAFVYYFLENKRV